jgi:hypothetical protein
MIPLSPFSRYELIKSCGDLNDTIDRTDSFDPGHYWLLRLFL